MVFLGGSATLTGPLLGALLIEPIRNYLTLQFNSSDLDLILFGGVLLVIILFLPQGVVPTLHKWWVTWRTARSAAASPPDLSSIPDQHPSALAEGGEGARR
jgi:branched-chain amino acid transport system permease protein